MDIQDINMMDEIDQYSDEQYSDDRDVNEAVEGSSLLSLPPSEIKYLCQPGRYSGDCWHVGAALLLDPSIQIVVPRPAVTPMVLKIGQIKFPNYKPLYFEIQLRSSLGIVTTFSSDEDGPFIFFYSGYVEFWIDVWVAGNNQVMQFHQAIGVNQLQPSLKFTVQASHTMSWDNFLGYIDEYIPLTGPVQPLLMELQCSGEPVATTPGKELNYAESFALENLREQLLPIAKPVIEKLVKNLLEYTRKQYHLNLDGGAELELALLENICGSPRRLFIGGEQVTVAMKIRSRCDNEWMKFLLKKPMQVVTVQIIEAFKTDNQKKQLLSEAAKTLVIEFGPIIFPSQKSLKKIQSDYVLKSNQFLDFYADCGIEGQRMVHSVDLSYTPRNGAQAYAVGREIVKRVCGDSNPLYGMTFAATSVLMKAVETWGVAAVRNHLRSCFTWGIPQAKRREIEKKLAILNGTPCVLLNMRMGGYHPEHDVTEGIYRQIEQLAKKYKIRLIRVGGPQNLPWKVDNEVSTGLIDIYSDDDLGAYMPKEVDLRHTAYLWSCVADMDNVIGIIGGMSGSLDIAAYMGVRALCWDIALGDHEKLNKVQNTAEFQDRVRLLLSWPFMSLVRRKIGDLIGAAGNNQDILDTEALNIWFSRQDVLPKVDQKLFKPAKVVRKSDESARGFKAVLFYDLPETYKKLKKDK